MVGAEESNESSSDEQDTLAHIVAAFEQNQPWDTNVIMACLNVDSCYYMHVYPANDSIVSSGPNFLWFNSETMEYGGTFYAGIEDAGYYRTPVGAEQNTCGIAGCTDSTAINYDPLATIDVGCEYCEENLVLLTPDFVLSNQHLSWRIRQNGEQVQAGVLGSNEYNSFDLVCLPDGCYELVLSGNAWLFSTIILQLDGDTILTASLTQHGEVHVPFGINAEPCFEPGEIYGCTNPLGQNYNPEATIDDGSCDLINEECSLGVETYQDSITGAIHFDIDIYSTDYPIDIFWDFGDGSPISNEWWTQHTYEIAGTYMVCATLYSRKFFEQEPLCYDETCMIINTDDFGTNGLFLIVLNDNESGVENSSRLGQLGLSPNPVGDFIRLRLPQNQSLRSIRVYSLDGRIVLNIPDAKTKHHNSELDISRLAKGTYIVYGESNEGSYYSGRFVKL